VTAGAPDALAARLAALRERIAAAARRARRDPAEITLVGVGKRVPAARVAAAVAAGLRDVGESFVQEARAKIPEVAASVAEPPRWHLVGRLQRNKARDAVALFDWVHGVDREDLARELDRRAIQLDRRLAVLLQVNLSGEPQKGGATPDALPGLLAACRELAALDVRGLMTVPAAADDPESARPAFAQLRALRDALRAAPGGAGLAHLSMGMSHDFEVAVEEGATMVRIGTALFGARA
jgi:hypothetical protein